MGTLNPNKYFLYKKRFIIGYILLAIGFLSLILFVPRLAPVGLSNAEMNSAVTSQNLNFHSIFDGNLIDLPYHLLQKFVFKLLYGTSITDTQTGLRGFPNSIIPLMVDIDGERFEYETKMLIEVIDHKVPIDEVTIETIYFDNNAETHFNPIKDSIRIYKVIFASFFKFVLSSVS